MVSSASEELQHLAAYLSVPCGPVSVSVESQVPTAVVDGGMQVKGLGTIAKYLVKSSNMSSLLGGSPETQAMVNQWVEYRVTQVDRCSEERDVSTVLKELNSYLADRVFLAGCQLTLADIVMYLGLYKIFMNLTFYRKQEFINLSRWFDHVQHTPGLQQSLRKVFFQKNLIYSRGSH